MKAQSFMKYFSTSLYLSVFCAIVLMATILVPADVFGASPITTNSLYLSDRHYDTPDDLPSSEFTPIVNNSVGLSFSTNDLWLQIPLDESCRDKILLLDCSYFEEAIFYTPKVGGGFDSLTHRWDLDDSCVINNFLYPYFQLSDSVAYSKSAYVRISSIYSLNFSVQIVSPPEAHSLERNTLLLFGLIFGILLAMVAYNMIISSFVADKSYRYYILYVASMGIYQFAYSGIGSLLPACGLHHLNHYMLPLAVLTLVTALLFTISYLDLKEYSTRLNGLITKFLMPICVLIFICSLFITTPTINYIVHVLAAISLPVIFFSGGIALKRGNISAKPFLVAWSFLIVGATVFIGRSMGFIPHSILTSHSLVIAAALEALLLSAALAQYIRKMYKEREVLTQSHESLTKSHESLTKSHESLTELSTHDDLTGLYNKRYFRQILAEITENLDRSIPLTIAVLDIDHFKNYNDTYGHLQGDTVLRVIGELFYDSIDECDIPCRYGGEEFVFIMPECAIDKALSKMDEMRERIAELHFVTSQGETTQITASIGITKYKFGEDTSQFFIRADKALYVAKEDGRNRVVVG